MLNVNNRTERGSFNIAREIYGYSALGAPLLFFPAANKTAQNGLILAGTHGDENAAIVALSCAMRTLQDQHRLHHVVLAMNPDGCQLGLRANANGVDLNRNFPAKNWQAGKTVYRWNSLADQRDVQLSGGESAASEPETQALCSLIERLDPCWIVSLHEPLACIDDPHHSLLAQWLSRELNLPMVSSVGYATPGSLGSWCEDKQLPCVTVEFPPISADEASERYLAALVALLQWQAGS